MCGAVQWQEIRRRWTISVLIWGLPSYVQRPKLSRLRSSWLRVAKNSSFMRLAFSASDRATRSLSSRRPLGIGQFSDFLRIPDNRLGLFSVSNIAGYLRRADNITMGIFDR